MKYLTNKSNPSICCKNLVNPVLPSVSPAHWFTTSPTTVWYNQKNLWHLTVIIILLANPTRSCDTLSVNSVRKLGWMLNIYLYTYLLPLTTVNSLQSVKCYKNNFKRVKFLSQFLSQFMSERGFESAPCDRFYSIYLLLSSNKNTKTEEILKQ